MPVLDNQRWELFALGVSRGEQQIDAYLGAGYSKISAMKNAATLAKRPEVAARIEELKKMRAEVATIKVVANKAWVMQQLTEVAIAAKADKQYAPCNRALELIGKEIGMFVERRDIQIDAYMGLSDKELIAAALKEIRGLIDEDEEKTIEGEYEEVGDE